MRLITRKYGILESLLIVSSPWTLLNSLKSLLTMTRSNMSQSKSTNKSKAKARSQPNLSKQDTICDGCCSAIIDNEQDAIQCEGCCQKWYHRLCAGAQNSIMTCSLTVLQKSSEGSSVSLNSTTTVSAGSSWSKVQRSRSRKP